MTKMITVAPVRKTVTVQASPARAFEVFTAGMSRWWPATHSLVKAAPVEHIVEPRVGGRWYQVGADGSECDNGKVLIWEPPARLVLVWQLNSGWQFDPNLHTEVELRFTPQGEGMTRVDLEHRNLERIGEKAEVVRASIDSVGGWSAILESFRAAASGR
jgi:uncharacterized protein YndB with AHSA1/START domain